MQTYVKKRKKMWYFVERLGSCTDEVCGEEQYVA